MATTKPRIQVTVDDDLASALAGVETRGSSRAKLLRDLAIRGARALQDEQQAAHEARAVFLAIADGTEPHDFEAVEQTLEQRGARLP